MNLVVDANILFAALIKKSATSEMMFKHTLFAPEFIFEELRKYKEEIKSKTERTDEEFNELLDVFERNVMLLPQEEIETFIKKAEIISPDPKDVIYIALALKQNCALWTNDKKLKSQNEVKIFSTEDLIKLDM